MKENVCVALAVVLVLAPSIVFGEEPSEEDWYPFLEIHQIVQPECGKAFSTDVSKQIVFLSGEGYILSEIDCIVQYADGSRYRLTDEKQDGIIDVLGQVGGHGSEPIQSIGFFSCNNRPADQSKRPQKLGSNQVAILVDMKARAGWIDVSDIPADVYYILLMFDGRLSQ